MTVFCLFAWHHSFFFGIRLFFLAKFLRENFCVLFLNFGLLFLFFRHISWAGRYPSLSSPASCNAFCRCRPLLGNRPAVLPAAAPVHELPGAQSAAHSGSGTISHGHEKSDCMQQISLCIQSLFRSGDLWQARTADLLVVTQVLSQLS